MKAHIQNVLRVAALSLTVVLAGMSTSNAAIIKGSFDPVFGNLFPRLSWQGSVDLYVPDACLRDGSDGSKTGNCGGEGGSMHVISASVELFKTTDGAHVETLDFFPSTLFPFALNEIYVENGTVTRIGTDYSSPVNPDEPSSYIFGFPQYIDGIGWYSFALGFDFIYGPRLLAFKDNGLYVNLVERVYEGSLGLDKFFSLLDVDPFLADTVVDINGILYSKIVDKALNTVDRNGNKTYSQLPGLTTNTYYFDLVSWSEPLAVPEPGSLLLVLCAIAALGATTRSRSKTMA